MRWETALLAVLGIMGPVFAQSTQPATTAPSEPFPQVSAPAEFRGEEVSPSAVFSRTIEARNAIRSLSYRMEFRDWSDNPEAGLRTGSVQFRGGLDCFLIEVSEGTTALSADRAPPQLGPRITLVHPEQILFWQEGTLNPQRILRPAHERWSRQELLAQRVDTQGHILARWGFGTVHHRTPEDLISNVRLRWFRLPSDAGRTTYERWSERGNSWSCTAQFEIDDASGLITRSRHIRDGQLLMIAECTLGRFPDSTETSKFHWIPTRVMYWSSDGRQRKFEGTVTDVQVNTAEDCDGLAKVALSRIRGANVNIFEMRTDGSIRVLGLQDGEWVDQNIPEAPSGATTQNTITARQASEAKDDLHPLDPETVSPTKSNLYSYLLIVSATLLIAAAVVTLWKLQRRRVQ